MVEKESRTACLAQDQISYVSWEIEWEMSLPSLGTLSFPVTTVAAAGGCKEVVVKRSSQ